MITVDESWWKTRPRLGVHILLPTDTQLELAKWVAWKAGTFTVYAYKKLA